MPRPVKARDGAPPVAPLLAALLLYLTVGVAMAQEPPKSAKITHLTNQEEAFKKASDADYKPAAVNDPVSGGDSLKTRKARLELALDAGKIVRMDEDTVMDLVKYFSQEAGKKKLELELDQGDIWSNTSGLGEDTEFDISSPIAGAAVRGTVFSLSVGEDKRTELQVYEGSMEVYNPTPPPKKPGASDSLKPKRVRGPKELPPPREVTLREWTAIVGANQKLVLTPSSTSISVTEITDADINRKKDWIEWNRKRDAELGLK